MMITKEDIKSLLLERKLYAPIDEEQLNNGSEFILDSLSLLWFLEGFEKKFGIQLSLEDQEWNEFTSVDSIYQVLKTKGLT
ncbi:hypothetical protein O9H85_31750 [Paenibacillus filicis]|uniref:Carrier domain-containing protein n=1 Tax=Paenibacillus gyeongsangnamensis TaxID=3388067 RepID=A0ABT4QJ09_9BACL|nr:hypothetical protein [Paenibacillus filicis]MCZ8516857.1 hypothetical protein [Paenibacillus filicis]